MYPWRLGYNVGYDKTSRRMVERPSLILPLDVPKLFYRTVIACAALAQISIVLHTLAASAHQLHLLTHILSLAIPPVQTYS